MNLEFARRAGEIKMSAERMRQTAEGAAVPLPRFAPPGGGGGGGGGGLQDGALGEARSALEVGGCRYALCSICSFVSSNLVTDM